MSKEEFGGKKQEKIQKLKDQPMWIEVGKKLEQEMTAVQRLEEQGLEPGEGIHPQLIDRFFQEEEAVEATLPHSKEQIIRDFSAEHLSGLSIKEYIALLKTVPSRFVTHVTRQGVREKGSHHFAGLGEFHRGFEGILERGVIQSSLERFLQGAITKETVRNALEGILHIPSSFKTAAEASHRIQEFLNSSDLNTVRSEISDASALHMAMETVADAYYGGESENEVFFVYPAAYVVSQCLIAHQGMGFRDKFLLSEEDKSATLNDYWIKEKGKGSLPVDAALVFLPADTLVHPEYGSKYELDEKRRPIPNTAQTEKIMKVIRSQNLAGHWNRIIEGAESLLDLIKKRRELEQKRTQYQNENRLMAADDAEIELKKIQERIQAAEQDLDPLFQELEAAGVTDSRFVSAFKETDFMKKQGLFELLRKVKLDPTLGANDPIIQRAVQKLGMQYLLAQTVISAQEYWESYFAKTEKRPSKVVYYHTATPTEALETFRREFGLDSQRHGEVDLKTLFQDNLISNEEMHNRMTQERELFAQYADELLEELYGNWGELTPDEKSTARARAYLAARRSDT